MKEGCERFARYREQVLLNLAVNARDAMPNGGVLDVEVGLVDVEPCHVVVQAEAQPGKQCACASPTGGTHLSAFREGLLKAVNEFSNSKFDGDDVREAMVGAVAIRLQDPVFESQTKNKLGNTEIRTELVNNVRLELLHFFQRNKQIAETIVAKVKDTQELRKELQQVKKLARERAKAITLRIPQLKDCKNHFDKKKEKGKGTMVFICEGQSAAGSITSCRDVNNQAVFVLKGTATAASRWPLTAPAWTCWNWACPSVIRWPTGWSTS